MSSPCSKRPFSSPTALEESTSSHSRATSLVYGGYAGISVNYPFLKDVGFSPPRRDLLIRTVWTSSGPVSAWARSKPRSNMFNAAFRSLFRTRPQHGQIWILTDKPFRTVSPHPEHTCDLPLGSTRITRPPRLSAARATLHWAFASF
jgi:hypothetical protein